MSKATAERARRVQVIGEALRTLAVVEEILDTGGDEHWLKLVIHRPCTEGDQVGKPRPATLSINAPHTVTIRAVMLRLVHDQRAALEAELRGKKRK